MKRLVVFSVLVIAVGAVLLELIRQDSGYVLISLGDTTIEMGFWVAVTAVLAVALAVWIIIALVRWVWHMLTGGFHLARDKRHRRAEKRTTAGLIYFIENDWRAAKKDLLRAAKHSDTPLVHYLAAARCSYELGERDETHRWLHKAEQIAPDNELAVLLSQARIQLSDKKFEQCLATLERARHLAPQHPTVLDLLRQVYWQLRDWSALRELLPALRKQHLYADDEQQLLEQNVYMALLTAAGQNAEKGRESGLEGKGVTPTTVQLLNDTWHDVPKDIRRQSPVTALYARLLIQAELHDTAEKLLRKQLDKQWDPELISLYGLVLSASAKEQLAVAERWLRDRAGDAELLLTLGRISLRNQLWGKAREYLEASLKLQPQPITYAELARLLEYLGDHEKSNELYQQGLLATTHGLPVLPMPGRSAALSYDQDQEDDEAKKLHIQDAARRIN